jgi:hypothetical protein
MCSIMEQERMEGEEVARYVQGSLLNKVRMHKKIKDVNEENNYERFGVSFMKCSVREKGSIT